MRFLPYHTNLVRILFCLALSSLVALPAEASTYLDINDDAYALLSRLEAEGVIVSGLLTTKPISRREAVRLLHEAEMNSEGRSAFIRSLVHELQERMRPEEAGAGGLKLLDSVYAQYINTNADVRTLTYDKAGEKAQALNADNDGDLYQRGGNGRIGFTSRMEDAGRFSFFLNPEFRAARSEGSDLVLKKGYAVFDVGWDLIAGRDSQWWGPGYHGALLLSDNSETLPLVKITNPSPVILPWALKHLGPFDFTLFVSQLEKDRVDVPKPYLWGMRMNFKPHPYFEIGLERTALIGGQGRPTNPQTWLNSLTGGGEHAEGEAGDQRAGYDLKLTLPFETQPVQVYLEADGEDGYHGLPSQWAYLTGLYLPRLLSLERVEFRFEWAQTYDPSRKSSWYMHSIYAAGYTYHGLIIGHHMGTDARDVFAELAIRVPEKRARVSMAFDRTEHNMSQDIHETDHELSLRALMGLAETVDLELAYGYSWIDNVENAPDRGWRGYSAAGKITRRF